ncbi:hypothetical protein JHW43_008827 [Diplocarpon mali]|nr:hypothetical protein JHW43_008827 [Diplocarpon mali]
MAASPSTAIFGLNLLTLQSNHRAVYTPADSLIFMEFCSSNPAFLAFLKEFSPTPTKLANKEFGLRELYEMLGADYKKLETMVNPDKVPVLQLLNAKVYSKIARTCANMDRDYTARRSPSAISQVLSARESVEREVMRQLQDDSTNTMALAKDYYTTPPPDHATAREKVSTAGITMKPTTNKSALTEVTNPTAFNGHSSRDVTCDKSPQYAAIPRYVTTPQTTKDSNIEYKGTLEGKSRDELFAQMSEIFARKEKMKASRAQKVEMLKAL